MTGTHLPVVIIIAGSLGLSPVVETRVLARQNRVVGVCLDVFLQVLWPLERLAAELALVRLKRNMDANV